MRRWFRASVFVVSFLCGGICAVTAQQPASLQQVSQGTAAAKPSFETASIKPCQPSGHSGGWSGGGGVNTSAGRLNVTCLTIAEIIARAYAQIGGPCPVNAPRSFLDPHAAKRLVSGGPDWIYTERYTIEANTSVAAPPTAIVGPMLRALLGERLGLALHQDPRHIPGYAVRIAKGGFKLSPVDPGNCRSLDPNALGRTSAPAPGERPLCANSFGVDGPNVTWKATGVTLSQVACGLGMVLDGPVIDRTGIAGQFTFKAEFDPNNGDNRDPIWLQTPTNPNIPNQAASLPSVDPWGDMPPGRSIFKVLEEQLGLILTHAPGPQVLVVDHVERPSGG
jgi:uncharacterized protein (TIGR03435 family)